MKDQLFKEERYSTRIGVDLPMPQPVLNVLNSVPTTSRTSVYRWLVGEGVRQAALNRKRMAAEWSQRLGIELPEDALFSKKAHEQIPELGQAYPEIEKEWFRGSEPDLIPIKHEVQAAKRRKGVNPAKPGETYLGNISLRDINATLVANGKEPLYFGGTNGLMEYIEGGHEWLPEAEPWALGGAEYEKHGHPLSLGQGIGLRNVPKYGYVPVLGQHPTQGGYVPPLPMETYGRSIKNAVAASAKLVNKIKNGTATPEELQKYSWLQDMIKRNELMFQNKPVSFGRSLGLRDATSVAGEKFIRIPPPEEGEQDHYELAKQAMRRNLRDCLQTGRQSPQTLGDATALKPDQNGYPIVVTPKGATYDITLGTPDDVAIENIINMFFNDNIRGIRHRLTKRFSDAPRVHQNLVALYLINKGVADLKNEKAWKGGLTDESWYDISKGLIAPRKAPAALSDPLDLNTLYGQGWRVASAPDEDQPPYIHPSRTALALQHPQTGQRMKLVRRNADEPWRALIEKAPGVIDLKKLSPRIVNAAFLGRNGEQVDEPNAAFVKLTVNNQRKKTGEIYQTEMLGRKMTDENGNTSWARVPQFARGVIKKPLFAGASFKPNAQQHGISGSFRFSPEENTRRYEHWLQHPELYHDAIKVISGRDKKGQRGEAMEFPQSIVYGVESALRARGQEFNDELKAKKCHLATIALQNQLANPRFLYGDLNSEKFRSYLVKFLSGYQDLEDEEMDAETFQQNMQRSINEIIRKLSLIANANKQITPQQDVNGIVDVQNGTVEQSLYDLLLKNGYRWRKKVAKGIARSRDIEEKNAALGQTTTAQGKEGPEEVNLLANLEDMGMSAEDMVDYYTEKYAALLKQKFSDRFPTRAALNRKAEELAFDRVAIEVRGEPRVIPPEYDIDQVSDLAAALTPDDKEEIKQDVRRRVIVPDAAGILDKAARSAPRPRVAATAQAAQPEEPEEDDDDIVKLAASAAAAASPVQPQVTPAPAAAPASDDDDIMKLAAAAASPVQPQVTPAPASASDDDDIMKLAAAANYSTAARSLPKREGLIGYRAWCEAGGDAVYDGTKPRPGCGFNWWGTVGLPFGTEIQGHPIGTKEDRAERRKKKSKKQ